VVNVTGLTATGLTWENNTQPNPNSCVK
jgi:hypothetical protein